MDPLSFCQNTHRDEIAGGEVSRDVPGPRAARYRQGLHMQTLIIDKLGFNQYYSTFTSI